MQRLRNNGQMTGSAGIPDVNDRDFARRFIFRPMPWDHPGFTGSNPAMDWDLAKATAQANGPDPVDVILESMGIPRFSANPVPRWDVDNDGDGIPDSVWIDVGLPLNQIVRGVGKLLRQEKRQRVIVHVIDASTRC